MIYNIHTGNVPVILTKRWKLLYQYINSKFISSKVNQKNMAVAVATALSFVSALVAGITLITGIIVAAL